MRDKLLLKVVNNSNRGKDDNILLNAIQDREHTKVVMLVLDTECKPDEFWHTKSMADNMYDMEYLDISSIKLLLDMVGCEIDELE